MKKSIYIENVEREIKRQIKWSDFRTDLEMREFIVKIMEHCEKLFDKSLDKDNMRMKPKENKGYNAGTYDECQTPPYALEPLFPHLPKFHTIWECAAGKRTLTRELQRYNYKVISTDINDGCDFLEDVGLSVPYAPTIITNPPYSLKYEWLQRCYAWGFPFALLMPVEMLGTAKGQKLFEKYGIEVIFMSPRVDFYMPHKGYEGGGAQFPTAWFTWKLNLPQQINFATLNKPKRSELKEYWKKALGE